MIKKMLMGGVATASVLALVAGLALLTNVRVAVSSQAAADDAASRPVTGQAAGENASKREAESAFSWIGAMDSKRGAKRILEIQHRDGKDATMSMHALPAGVMALSTLPDPSSFVEAEGVVVTDLVKDSAAFRAGLQRGDVITAINGVEVDSALEIHEATSALESGSEMRFSILHGDESREIRLAKTEDEGMGFVTSRCGGDWAAPIMDMIALEDGGFVHEINDGQVMGIEPGSAAEVAGLEAGDRIVAVDGQEIGEALSLVDAIGQRAPGDAVSLSVERDRDEGEGPEVLELNATLGEHPDDANKGFLGVHLGISESVELDFMHPDGGFGFMHEGTLPFDLKLDLESLDGIESGALIMGLEENSPAAEAGLQEGEWITMVDGEELDSPRALTELVEARSAGENLRLTVRDTEGEMREVDVILAAAEGTDGARLGVAIGGFVHVEKHIIPGHFERDGSWRDHLRGIFRGHGSDSEAGGPAGAENMKIEIAPADSSDL